MSREKASFLFPPGVRFHPSDEELIVYYLLNKLNARPLPAAVVGEIELYNHNPWDLPKKALFGEDEWYFFSPRERKYPNGARPNRSAASGYWKATGTDKVISSSSGARIGVKKALVFYVGKPPNGVKTDWIMIEYRIPDTLIRPQKSKGSMRLDHWVLCRIKQKGNAAKNMWENDNPPPNQNRPTGDIPNMNDLPPVSSNPLSEVCSNYFQSNDSQLLAELGGANNQDLPQVTSSARTISQRSSNIGRLYNASTYEHDSSMDSARMTDSSYNNFEGSYNQMSTPSYSENGYGDFSQYNRGGNGIPVLNTNESDVAVGLPPPSNNNTGFYDRHEPRDIFNLNLSGPMANLHSDMFDNHFRQPVNSLSASEF